MKRTKKRNQTKPAQPAAPVQPLRPSRPKKSIFMRILVLCMAAATLLGFVLLPLLQH